MKEAAASRALSMKSSPLEGILPVRESEDEVPDDGPPTVGSEGMRVTPLTSAAWRLGRESATVSESAGGAARLNCGGPEPESRGAGAAVVAESPGVISAFGVPSSELETARRSLGGPSSPLFEELPEELPDEPFDELLDELPAELPELLSELDEARRSLGRSGSLSLEELFDDDELPDELPELSSELDEARRSFGRSGSLSLDDEELPDDDELLALSPELDAARRNVGWLPLLLPAELLELAELLEEDELSDDLPGRGFVSSVCNDASECSSGVPSLTIVIVLA